MIKAVYQNSLNIDALKLNRLSKHFQLWINISLAEQ